ncbi:MAG: DUF1698 domain-containing protein [bacterium]|nr:DUF1698 domain-containing protein [bacterium]
MSIKKYIKRLSSTISNFRKNANKQPLQPNEVALRDLGNTKKKEEIYIWIKEGIEYFREWYQPVNFGNGVIAHVTTPPNWEPRPELLNTNDRGLGKWEYIIKKHIPELAGKRVLDIGCSSGVFSLEMARMGAKEVVGIDRDVYIKHRSSDTPPPQNVIAQANFVKKASELLDEVTYPITYIAHDIGKLEDLNLKTFDLILALNIVYHELDNMDHLVSYLSTLTDHLILQTSLGHGGALGRKASVKEQVDALLKSGFTKIEVDAPLGYLSPMIIGKK